MQEMNVQSEQGNVRLRRRRIYCGQTAGKWIGMNNILEEVYSPLLMRHGFQPAAENHPFCPSGKCFQLSPSLGNGVYWVYGQRDLFDIKIHDFYFHKDIAFEFYMPECLSVTYYESISGEELAPFRVLQPNCVKSYLGGKQPFKAIIHKKVPVRSIGIEILPAYYKKYLRLQYPEENFNPQSAFEEIGDKESFPEMVRLLNQIKNYKGSGMGAKLFFEGKVLEAVALIAERSAGTGREKGKRISSQDKKQLELLGTYISENCARELPLGELGKIACMGMTKLKESFKLYYGCTVTEYLQARRMDRAENLLAFTELPIHQVAEMVGYANAGRFSQLFRKHKGILPGEYRCLVRKS